MYFGKLLLRMPPRRASRPRDLQVAFRPLQALSRSNSADVFIAIPFIFRFDVKGKPIAQLFNRLNLSNFITFGFETYNK